MRRQGRRGCSHRTYMTSPLQVMCIPLRCIEQLLCQGLVTFRAVAERTTQCSAPAAAQHAHSSDCCPPHSAWTLQVKLGPRVQPQPHSRTRPWPQSAIRVVHPQACPPSRAPLAVPWTGPCMLWPPQPGSSRGHMPLRQAWRLPLLLLQRSTLRPLPDTASNELC